MENTRFKLSQYACAVLLVVSSIALVSYQVAGSIFGLDQYIRIIKRNYHENTSK